MKKKDKIKSKVKIVGTHKDGYVITVKDSLGFKGDLPLFHEELVILKKEILKILS